MLERTLFTNYSIVRVISIDKHKHRIQGIEIRLEKKKKRKRKEGQRERCVMLTHVNAFHKLFHLSFFLSLIPKQNSCLFLNSSLDALIFGLYLICVKFTIP